METTLYDDSQFRIGMVDVKATKRPVTLDLDSPAGTVKKQQRFASILTSPDLNMLKLGSPELERLIMAQSGGAITTTPTPTQFLFPKNVTEEQEKYAKGFVDALALLHQSGENTSSSNGFQHFQILEAASMPSSTTNPSAATIFYTGMLPLSLQAAGISTAMTVPAAKPLVTTTALTSIARPPSVESTSSNSYQGTSSISLSKKLVIKEELQTVPSDSSTCTPPLSPINLENQERIKLERKRYRNRIAASKCRKRKLERISKLEDKVAELKNENSELGTVATKLREQVCSLKQQVLEHVKNGCKIMLTHTF